jgi:ubiquinone/menaquinone biosynthesis C-methylase UbiE
MRSMDEHSPQVAYHKSSRTDATSSTIHNETTPSSESPQAGVSYVDKTLAPVWLAGMNTVPEVTQYKQTSYELLELEPGMTVLDLGCGVGDDARSLFDLVQPGGSVIGVDASVDMINQARARHLEAIQPTQGGLPASDRRAGRLEFRVGSAEGIPLPDRSCDAVRADRLLQHVSDPLIVLHEVQRILRPEGLVVLVEPDWRAMIIHPGSESGGDDDRAVEAVWKWQIGHTRHPLMGRQLRARLRQAGFTEVRVIPVAYSTTSFALISYVLELAAAGEAAAAEDPPQLNRAELQSWFRAAERAEASGEFYAAIMLFFGVARKRT